MCKYTVRLLSPALGSVVLLVYTVCSAVLAAAAELHHQSADGSLSVRTMDLDRVTMMASDTHGSLLNRVSLGSSHLVTGYDRITGCNEG